MLFGTPLVRQEVLLDKFAKVFFSWRLLCLGVVVENVSVKQNPICVHRSALVSAQL